MGTFTAKPPQRTATVSRIFENVLFLIDFHDVDITNNDKFCTCLCMLVLMKDMFYRGTLVLPGWAF
jgi:hypothetical protein